MDKYEILHNVFKYQKFRDVQEIIVDSLLRGNDTMAILKTGGGKSICFQIPALLRENLTIVISPLISLMYDQVQELNLKNIKATFINSSLEKEELYVIYNNLKRYKIIYVSPERLLDKIFLSYIKRIKIDYLVIDEAHTIMWHMDFRESFLNIGKFVRMFNYKIPMAFFSATANEYIISEIKRVIGIYNLNIIKSSFDRPDLFYRVLINQNKDAFIINYLKDNNNPGIIYCNTRKDVMRLYEMLKDKYNVIYYHGALDNKIKEKNQNSFIKSSDFIMIATNAFGIGINKPDIRFVINYNMPDSVETMCQMLGRASRDNKGGEGIILYNDSDLRILNYFIKEIDSSNKSISEINRIKKYKYYCLNSIKKIILSNVCIHKSIAKYYGEKIENCKNMCSVCKK